MYIRFQTPDGEGIFALAGRARCEIESSRPRVARRHLREFEHLHDWLTRCTPVPARGAYIDPRCRRPTTWFRESAREHVAQAWRLCEVLNLLGYRVRPCRSINPGAIIWEDEVQVIVRHHRGEPAPRRAARCERRRTDGWDGDRTTIRRWSRRARRRAGLETLAAGATLGALEHALRVGAPVRRGRRASEREDWGGPCRGYGPQPRG